MTSELDPRRPMTDVHSPLLSDRQNTPSIPSPGASDAGYTRSTLGRRYALGNATLEQASILSVLDAARACVFCPDGLEVVEVMHEVDGWLVVRVPWRHPDVRVQRYIVPAEHLTDLAQLEVDEWRTVGECLRWSLRYYWVRDYRLEVGCGDLGQTGEAIQHLHLRVVALR